MDFANTVTIRRDISDVFAFLENWENVPKWNYAIRETRKSTPGPVGVGTRYTQIRTLPTETTETFELIDHKSNERLAIQGKIGPFFGVLTYELSRVPEGTRVTNRATLDPRGPGRMLTKLGGSRVREAVSANLTQLQKILES